MVIEGNENCTDQMDLTFELSWEKNRDGIS
jgi:hypothetical protein